MTALRHGLKDLTKKQKIIAALIVVVIAAFCIHKYYVGSGAQKTNIKKGVPVVSVYTVERQDMMRHVALSGQTVSEANIALAPKYTGKVTAVNVDLGDYVHKGQVLMEQDTGDLDISIRENVASTRAAEADARVASATYDADYIKAKNDFAVETDKYKRNQYLYQIGAISLDTLDTVQQEYMASKAALDILENQVQDGNAATVDSKTYAAEKEAHATDALRKQREDLFLRAPSDGVIGYRNVEVGSIVSAGTKVLSLVDNSSVDVDCTLSENDAAILAPGMDVIVTIDALGRDVEGQIIYVSPAMDETSKTYQVRIELDEKDDSIKAGLYAHTAIDILQKHDTLFVPKEAVLTKNGEPVLFVLDSDGKARERKVKIGLLNDESEEILDGVEEGDTVIISNQDKLKDGTAVEVTE